MREIPLEKMTLRMTIRRSLTKRAATASHFNGNFQLSLYVEELADYRVNLERYNRLVGKDPDSLNTLRHLVII